MQLEASHRARLSEEIAARDLLHKKSAQYKTKQSGDDDNPANISNVHGLTRLVPTLSAQELTRLGEVCQATPATDYETHKPGLS